VLATGVIQLPAREAAVDVEKVVAYIERCQTADGGFFFARVPPAGAADTYHAVAALRILGRKPARTLAVCAWLRRAAVALLPGHPRTVFHLTQAGLALGMNRSLLRRWAAALGGWENERGGFGAWRNLYVEVPSELETTYYAVITGLDLGLEVNRDKVSRFVLSFQNSDGGFGGGGHSTLASTYYAVWILTRLGLESYQLQVAADWLGERASARAFNYLEELYWLTGGLEAVGSPIVDRERTASFVLACQRSSGGFSRAPVGIATLEYTHYALEILRGMGSLP